MSADPRPSLEEIRQRAASRLAKHLVWCSKEFAECKHADMVLLRDLLAVLPQGPSRQGKIGEALGLSGNILCVPKESHD
jgi:hypothetical protein